MNIYVSNISFHTTEEILGEMFSMYGTVTSVKIIRTGKPGERVFGFIEMTSADAAREAVNKLDGKEIQARRLSVSIAKDSFHNGTRKTAPTNSDRKRNYLPR